MKVNYSAIVLEDISRIFARLVLQRKITAAIKLLYREGSTALVTPTREVLVKLEKKHLSAAEIREECLLNRPIDQIPPNIFDLINEQMLYDSALKTKGSADLYRRILCSRNFAIEGKLLREEI